MPRIRPKPYAWMHGRRVLCHRAKIQTKSDSSHCSASLLYHLRTKSISKSERPKYPFWFLLPLFSEVFISSPFFSHVKFIIMSSPWISLLLTGLVHSYHSDLSSNDTCQRPFPWLVCGKQMILLPYSSCLASWKALVTGWTSVRSFCSSYRRPENLLMLKI